MKKYIFRREAESVNGYQFFSVMATSEEEARIKLLATGGEFEGEELEVTDLSPIEAAELNDVIEDQGQR